MSKYVVVEIGDTEYAFPGVSVLRDDDPHLYAMQQYSECSELSQHETLEEAQAVAQTIAALKNLTIRSWSL